jgi:hypothetical protein
MRNRYGEGKDMPRVVYPCDVMPDENNLSELSPQELKHEMDNIDGRIGTDDNR